MWQIRCRLPDKTWRVLESPDRNDLDAAWDEWTRDYAGLPLYAALYFDGRYVGCRSRHFAGF